jgi:RND family efflux transporter MFP subunit
VIAMKKIAALLVLIALGFALGFGYGRWYGPFGAHSPTVKKAETKKGYHCPMHPDIRSDKPGDCGICGMRLVPDDDGDKPVPKSETGHDLTVTVPADKQQWIGLKTAVVERASSASVTLRAPGRVMVDETRIVRVQTRYEGWIQSVLVDFTGRLVKKGEPMLTLYSPELVASQQEYLLALRAKETLSHSSLAHVGTYNASMIDVARNRLLYHWGMSATAVEELERTGEPRRIQTVYAPADGFVTARNAFANQRVTPETELYTLADLGRVWIVADINEADAANVRIGSPAVIEPAYAAGRRLRGRVSYILPQVDAQTRTLKARIEADNPEFLLKPDLFVNVEFAVGRPAHLAVPEDAVLDSGSRQIVYIDKGQGVFEPREVVTGEHFEGRVEILAGLKEGERVVAAGAFLLDSESRMKAPAEHKHD